MNTKSTCPFCKNSFTKMHGNQIYCSTKCKNYQKASTQYKLYGILKEFRKGFLNNYKLFERLVPEHGINHFLLSDLLIHGFNSDCFYGRLNDSEKYEWYRVGPYTFTMTRNDKIVTVTIKK